jgi:hypothetical protein
MGTQVRGVLPMVFSGGGVSSCWTMAGNVARSYTRPATATVTKSKQFGRLGFSQ